MSQLCYPLSASGSSLLPSPQLPAKLHIYFRTPKISPPPNFSSHCIFLQISSFLWVCGTQILLFFPQITRIHSGFLFFLARRFRWCRRFLWRQLSQILMTDLGLSIWKKKTIKTLGAGCWLWVIGFGLISLDSWESSIRQALLTKNLQPNTNNHTPTVFPLEAAAHLPYLYAPSVPVSLRYTSTFGTL